MIYELRWMTTIHCVSNASTMYHRNPITYHRLLHIKFALSAKAPTDCRMFSKANAGFANRRSTQSFGRRMLDNRGFEWLLLWPGHVAFAWACLCSSSFNQTHRKRIGFHWIATNCSRQPGIYVDKGAGRHRHRYISCCLWIRVSWKLHTTSRRLSYRDAKHCD